MNTAQTLIPEEAPATDGNSRTLSQSSQSLRGCVEQAMENYFQNLDGQPVSDVYDMVMAEVEAPLLEIVLKYTRHNQTKAAQVLGLNRGTLRKKLKQYGLL
ncbi:DNA-binding transcriptional regulator Fis [Marinimicrobium sp. ABcell2]|uniref:DNA-binding transcriptional regulator Fis n=1 Tax=Marinimicrobium sp. ABcell2 TaxID=3069751 RepID=UPI0027B85E31|nr:DNA-binding transcriptional regulator Fis [Marinimicrobium sp. ABcell2]MDQ2078238.1 DNA-binding transcriptional regulator Fis [Marinimicrobium sp. ABcell2]